mmetsp:Transcript_103756/g.334463  ORF Transcript_103756/g.334463 Transcript_103756/m.334463 type:complete len:231 (-) Transcript_103756:390-1082(-)
MCSGNNGRQPGRGFDQKLPVADLKRANVPESGVLQELSQARMSQGRFGEVQAEAGAEETLHAGDRDDANLCTATAAEDCRKASPCFLPSGNWVRGLFLLLHGVQEWLLPSCTLLLHGLLRMAVGYQVAIGVSDDLLLGHGKLHDVADLAQGSASEPRQAFRGQGLCTRISASRQQRILAPEASEVAGQCSPKHGRIWVERRRHVHKHGVLIEQKNCDLVLIELLHHQSWA